MKGKPRHNNENQLSKRCNQAEQHRFINNRFYCDSYDGEYTASDGTVHTILEFSDPWCQPDGPNGCKCNPYNCIKMRNRWFASLSKKQQDKLALGKAHIYSSEITMSDSTRKIAKKH